MNKFSDALKDVKNELYQDPLIKEYFSLLEQINNDEYLIKLDKEMKHHQNKMCQNMNNDEVYLSEKEAYEKCLNELKNNPLYVNFCNVKEEVKNLLSEVKDALQ